MVMAVQMNNIRRLVVIYWRHSSEDRENSWTKELYEKLIYDDRLNLRYHSEMKFIFANCNRKTESYYVNRDIVEELRRHKIRREPLVYLDLIFPNERGSREEIHSISNKYDMEQIIERINYYINIYQR